MKRLLLLIAIVAAFASCKKDENPLMITTNLELFYKQTGELNATHQCIYVSSDTTIAIVNNAGMVTARRVGNCKITAQSKESGDKADCMVVVAPRSNLYASPFMTRYETPTFIMALEKRVLLESNSGNLIYSGENSSVRFVMYLFETNMLSSAAVLLENTNSVVTEAKQFLDERYKYVGLIDSNAFAYRDGKMIMVLSLHETLGLNVIYYWSDSKGIATGYKTAIQSHLKTQ